MVRATILIAAIAGMMVGLGCDVADEDAPAPPAEVDEVDIAYDDESDSDGAGCFCDPCVRCPAQYFVEPMRCGIHTCQYMCIPGGVGADILYGYCSRRHGEDDGGGEGELE